MLKRKHEGEDHLAHPLKRQQLEADAVSIIADSDYTDLAPSDDEEALTITTATTPTSPHQSRSEKKLACPFPGCSKRFNRPCRLTTHLRSHTGERPFVCTHEGCDKTYREDKHLKHHISAVHQKNRPHKCSYEGCDARFETSTKLARHEEIHKDKGNKFFCRDYPPCNLVFRQPNVLERHIREAHLNLPAYQCPEEGCDAAFRSSGALRNHKLAEHTEHIESFFCNVCDDQAGPDGRRRPVGFSSNAALREHLRLEHIVCSHCGAKFHANYDLQHHIELRHSGKTVEERKTFVCSWDGCSKSFTRASNLNQHIRTAHRGHRWMCDYPCVDGAATPGTHPLASEGAKCGRTFVNKAKLNSHIARVHLGEPTEREKSLSMAPEQSRPTQPTGPDILSVISGRADEEKRTIPCGEPGCLRRFIREHDRSFHLATDHASLEVSDYTSLEMTVLQMAPEEIFDATMNDVSPQISLDTTADSHLPRDPSAVTEDEVGQASHAMSALDDVIDPNLINTPITTAAEDYSLPANKDTLVPSASATISDMQPGTTVHDPNTSMIRADNHLDKFDVAACLSFDDTINFEAMLPGFRNNTIVNPSM